MPARRSSALDALAVVGKAFASAKRLEIIELLAQREQSVDELVRTTGMGLSTVSAHLQILRASNLVRTRRAGTKVFYRVSGEDVATLFAALGSVARHHSADVEQALDAYVGSGVAEAGEVSREDLVARLAAGEVVLLDVRPAQEFSAGHIADALSMPLEDLGSRLGDLPAERDVVAYCRGAYCVLAHDAVTILREHGRPAARLQDGILEWRQAGLPVAVEPAP